MFMCDFLHFTGASKPWLEKPPTDLSDLTWLKSANHVWWHFLTIVDEEHNMGLDFDRWKTGQRPTLGFFAEFSEMNERVDKLKKESLKIGTTTER
jgi:lipopolysaccharide biosynthesis glycosyltransferase